MLKFKKEQIVQFNTVCIWNKCSGKITKVNENEKQCSVEFPDGKTVMGFGFHELVIKG